MTDSAVGRKKVLFVVDKSGFGGVQSIANGLMACDIQGVELFFLFLRNVNGRFGMEDIVRRNVFYAKSSNRFSLRSFLSLADTVRKNRIDILHLNGNKAVIFGALLKILMPRLKTIAHDHGGVFDYSWWYAAFLRVFKGCIDLFVGVSNRRRKFYEVRCRVAPEKVQVVNNFVDPSRFPRRADSLPRRARQGDFVVGYLGGLSPLKGCDVLLEALPSLREHIPTLRVIIAGEGPSRRELEQFARELGCADIVKFLGYTENAAEVYEGFDVMVIPSRAEEGPISLYEAWAMRVPVVASNAPVLDERIADGVTGLLFRSEDSLDLAEKVHRISCDPVLSEELVNEGQAEAEGLTLDHYVVQLRELYLGSS